jgi:bifunctional non-homologous end joining protein LigD
MPLARLQEPFDHPEWIYELKYDGFRALAYIQDGSARLVSRNGDAFKSFDPLRVSLAAALPVREAILDGEIVHLASDGRPEFYPLLGRRGEPRLYAFDLLWLDGQDIRALLNHTHPKLDGKIVLRLVGKIRTHLFYVPLSQPLWIKRRFPR